MTIDHDERAERDDLALLTPTKRLHSIAEILAQGVRRKQADARRIGGITPHREREREGLELSEPVRPDRPRG